MSEEVMYEQISASGVWREALTIIRRYPLATIMPAAVLGAVAEAPYYFIHDSNPVWEQILASLTSAFAFYLFVAYAEGVAAEAERGAARLTLRDVVGKLQQAIPIVLPVIVASTIALGTAAIATVLLVLPGLWLLTRWSLFAPVIKTERLGPVAALKRSNQLVRGHFWAVFLTATLAFIFEEMVIDMGGSVGVLISDSETWGEWLGAVVAGSLISPLAALTTSTAYRHLTTRASPCARRPSRRGRGKES
jgi:hypothetical protein